MRTECQEAEVALSYLRRLVQGRLDIVHAYIEHLGRTSRLTCRPWWRRSPTSCLRDRAGHRAPGTCHSCSRPTPRSPDLTAELDAVLGADDIASLAASDGPAEGHRQRLEAIEQRLSSDRRALHERIDALQAELVERHKSGRATVDGLLS